MRKTWVAGHRDLRDQGGVGHAEVRLRVLRAHAALVAEEDPRLRPRHLLAQRRLRQSLIGGPGRAATGERDREASARLHRLQGGVDDGAGGGRRRARRDRPMTMISGACCMSTIILFRPDVAGVPTPRGSGRDARRRVRRPLPSGAGAAARSGRAPSASSASSAAPRLVASLSGDQWIGRPRPSASMRVQAREWATAPPGGDQQVVGGGQGRQPRVDQHQPERHGLHRGVDDVHAPSC